MLLMAEPFSESYRVVAAAKRRRRVTPVYALGS
jgi:hypothetical protein